MPGVPVKTCLGWPCAIRNMVAGWGRWRWVVERTFAWLNQFRRLRLGYEKRPDMHLAFLTLACILICWKFLQAQPAVVARLAVVHPTQP